MNLGFKLHLLPNHGQICENSCRSFLCSKNFILYHFAYATKQWNWIASILTKACCVSRTFFVLLHLLPSHGEDLWAFLHKLLVFQDLKKKLHLILNFGQICEHSCKNFFCFRNCILCIFAFVTKSWNRLVNILAKACCASLLSLSSPKIIIHEFFSL